MHKLTSFGVILLLLVLVNSSTAYSLDDKMATISHKSIQELRMLLKIDKSLPKAHRKIIKKRIKELKLGG